MVMFDPPLRRLIWVGGCKKDLLTLPDAVQDVFGYALYLAQVGRRHDQAKALKGFGSAGVLEVVEDWRGDAYRAVYTVKFEDAVYVLHCFQKKSVKGVATSKLDMGKVRSRLKAAEDHAKERS